jgi:excisionase family DNA binding protein
MLSIKQAAEALGVHEQTLRAWERKGIIKAKRLPGSRYRRFDDAEIERDKAIMAADAHLRPFDRTSSLFDLVGIGRSGRSDISQRTDAELADVYQPEVE